MPDSAIDTGQVVWLTCVPDASPSLTRLAGPQALDELTRRFFPCSLQRWLLALLEGAPDDRRWEVPATLDDHAG